MFDTAWSTIAEPTTPFERMRHKLTAIKVGKDFHFYHPLTLQLGRLVQAFSLQSPTKDEPSS
jgi:hypothetical protein